MKPATLGFLFEQKQGLMTTTALILIALGGIALPVQALVESRGVFTVEDDRASLKASDYKLNLRDGFVFMNAEEGWKARILDLRESPALGGRDVQFQVADGTIQPKGRFLRHYHPRSAEVIYQKSGRMEVRIEFENGSVATNNLMKDDILVIPQGLIHDARCLSKRKMCTFIATFRSADPGLVPLPSRE